MRELGVHTDHLGILELADERERVAHGREQEIPARLVRLRLDREFHRVPLFGDVRATRVDRLRVTIERGGNVFRGVALHTLATTPHHVHGGTDLRTEVDPVDGLAQRVPANLRIVGREGTIFENRLREQVGGGHRRAYAGLFERALKPLDDLIALGG